MGSVRLSSFWSLILLSIIFWGSCRDKKKETVEKPVVVIKGLYSFGPEAALFIDCGNNKEYWTADSSAQLELQYSQLASDKPYETIYIEVEGDIKPSGKEGPQSAYDSTLTVTKVIKITKDIPNDICK